jgi:glucose/arabinose dehydrogenase
MKSMTRRLIFAAAVAMASLQFTVTTQQAFSSRVIATGLKAPWEIVWGPDDYLWATERTGGRIIRVNPVDGTVNVAIVIPEVYPGQSWHEGLLGLALHPDLLKSSGRDYVYAAYTYDADAGPALVRR